MLTRYSSTFSTRRGQGFTLIELLVVIAILSILAATLFPVFARARDKARAIACLANCRQMALAISLYAQDWDEAMPSVRMIWPDVAPADSWLDMVQPYVKTRLLQRCPSDASPTWQEMPPRPSSYGFNAYFDPMHPPYGNRYTPRTFTLAGIIRPSECVFAAELSDYRAGTTVAIKADHFMPMYWGDPPRCVDSDMQTRQWDVSSAEPKTLAIRRHQGGANYVFADGHAKWRRFEQTWRQIPGNHPEIDFYDPLKE